MSDPTLRPGALFDGRYHLEAPLDDFGVGESWRARDRDGATVIVKLLPPLGASTARFNDLGRALSAARHRGVLATLRHGVCDGRPYLVHEFFAGVSLAKGFAQARTGRHLLAPGVLANLLDRACEALEAAHRMAPPLVHGGLMPGALVAAMVAGRFDVRVIDFGLAPVFGDRLKVARATEYMAPSLEDDPERATAADDVFALGTVVLEAVTDRRDALLGAGTVGNLSAVAKRRQDVPAALMAIASRATRVDPRQRYADVTALRDALDAAWSPDARPARDDAASEAPARIAGVAAEYTSWVRFADADAPSPIAPVAAPAAAPIVAPPRIEVPLPAVAFVSPPVDFGVTQPTARGPADELLGATTKLPPRGAPTALPPTQMLEQFDAPPPQPAYAPQAYAPPVYAPAPPPYAPPPQRVYGAAPQGYPQAPVAVPPRSNRGALLAVGVAVLLALVTVVVLLTRGS